MAVVIFAEPLNEVPFIVLAVCNVVAVEAFPDNEPLKDDADTVPGNIEFPLSFNSVNVLVVELVPAVITELAV